MCALQDGGVDQPAPSSSASPAVNVFVTGQPGIGKTTLVLNVAKQLPQDCIAGFYTVEAREPGTGERLGLDVVTLAGERVPLCRLRRGCGPKIGKYYVAISEFERVVLPQITPSKKIKLHIIDEIGRLELCSEKFREAVFKLLDSPKAVFGSIPAPRYGHTLQEVEGIKQRGDTAVLTLTRANRAVTAHEITELLKRLIKDAQDEDKAEEEDKEENGLKRTHTTEKDKTEEEGEGTGSAKNESQDESNQPIKRQKTGLGSNHEGEGQRLGNALEDALAQVADAILE